MRTNATEHSRLSDHELEWMRAVRGIRAVVLASVIAGIGIIAAGTQATPRVVADDACPYYEVDMAAFATCTQHGVAGGEVDTAAEQESAPARAEESQPTQPGAA